MTDRDRETLEHDRCHYIYDKVVGRVFIPGCMGAAALGRDECTCNTRPERSEIDKLMARIARVEKVIAKAGVAVYVRAVPPEPKSAWLGGIL